MTRQAEDRPHTVQRGRKIQTTVVPGGNPRCKKCKGETDKVLVSIKRQLVEQWECIECGKQYPLHGFDKRNSKNFKKKT